MSAKEHITEWLGSHERRYVKVPVVDNAGDLIISVPELLSLLDKVSHSTIEDVKEVIIKRIKNLEFIQIKSPADEKKYFTLLDELNKIHTELERLKI